MQGTSSTIHANSNLFVLTLSGAGGILAASSAELSRGTAILTGFGVAILILMVLGWAAHRTLA